MQGARKKFIVSSIDNITIYSRLTKTAGMCVSMSNSHKLQATRTARILLSTKVLDSADRLRDTLIHEMCHAASWIVSAYNGHGSHWIQWTEKAMKRFPELPKIDRCHSYKINCRYQYKCVNCGYTVGRHTKSLDTNRKMCGHCHGNFELVTKGRQTPAVSNGFGAVGSSTARPPENTLFWIDI